MKFVVDSHTHTISSGHAYSTLQENALVAAQKRLEIIAMTDHGPSVEGAPKRLFFSNLRVLPETICGVRILKGIEANILDYDGKIDLEDKYLKKLDWVIASFHDICIEPRSVEENTKAAIEALKNPCVDVLGHPDNPVFPVDIEKVVMFARDAGKFIEINNHSFLVRKGSEKNCREIIKFCKKHKAKIVCGSDAHVSFSVGNFSQIMPILKELEMPEELIINTSAKKMAEYIEVRKLRI